MTTRRDFLKQLGVAAGVVLAAGVPAMAAPDRRWFVWYKVKANDRYTSAGPYTYEEAQSALAQYTRRQFVGVYIGDSTGKTPRV